MAVPNRVNEELRAAEEALAQFVQQPPTPAPQPAEPPVAEVPPPAPVPPAPAPQPTATPTSEAAELARLRAQMSSLQGMFQSTQAELRRMQEAAARPAPVVVPPEAPPALLTEDERKEYGDGFLSVVVRAASEKFEPMLRDMLRRIEKIELGVTAAKATAASAAEQVAQTTEEKFFDRVTALVPDWETVNTSPEFVSWLQGKAPYSKNTKQELLNEAADALDAERVAQFFTDYKASRAPAPAASTAPAAPPVNPAEALISPSTSPSPAPNPSAQGQIWTEADVAELYRRQQKKQISPADFTRLEADMLRAVAEGRFRG